MALATLKAGDVPDLSGADRTKGLGLIGRYGDRFDESSLFNMLGAIRGGRENDLAAAKTLRYLAPSVSEGSRKNFSGLLKKRIADVNNSGSKDKDSIISLLRDAQGDVNALDYATPHAETVPAAGTEVGQAVHRAAGMTVGSRMGPMQHQQGRVPSV